MTFQPVLPWPILAVVAGALLLARLVALRQALLSAGRRRRAALRWAAVTLAVLMLIAATTRPALLDDGNQRGATPAGANLNVFLVVDRSAYSGVENDGYGQPRIVGMREDIEALIKRYPAARYALVGFASKASLDWPLSEDVWSLRPTITALTAQSPSPDADAGAADNVLRYQLIQATQQYPGSRNVVLYFGSGAPGSRVTQGEFNLIRGSVAGGAVLGYGRAETIDEAELRRLAAQLDVNYLHRDLGAPLQPLLPDSPPSRVDASERAELYWLPALLAAGLLLAEIYLSVREFRRGRIARRDLAS